jgi:hypothetical protein
VFKTLGECEARQKCATADAEKGKLTDFSAGFAGVIDTDPEPWLTQQIEADCMASDGPRLKEPPK